MLGLVIPPRVKFYGMVALAFLAALVGLRMHWMGQAVRREREKVEAARNRAIRRKEEARRDAAQLDDTSLADRISRGM